ncbi:hypothetical protein [Catalinimonas alkaloidigena]|nr:hypothetical protein [Catalinimonas alkaloidigena]
MFRWLAISYLIAGTLCAQSTPDALRTRLDYIFQPLNKSRVPTGFLQEYGVDLVPLDNFKGVRNGSSLVNIDVWRALYAT